MALVQARMSSRRLPGKVLREVAGRPLLGHLLDRLVRCRSLARVIVTTSTDRSDDELAAWCAAQGVDCRRGPLDDVAARFLEVAEREGLASFVRISGDSPLLDPAIVDRVVAAYGQTECDLATNVFPRSFPKGQSVEVVRTDALARVPAADVQAREHVTQYMYAHAQAFRIVNVRFERDASAVQLSVDTAEDLRRFAAIVARMTRPPRDYDLEQVLALRDALTSEPDPVPTYNSPRP